MKRAVLMTLLLSSLVACSSREPAAEDIAGILATKAGHAGVTAADIEQLSCKKYNEQILCEFSHQARLDTMTLVQVGGGAYSELR